ncbi:hypothetical protein J31TS4_16980 [Paenibacillus sp. J31TS4]|nr:hypothetical protein J31TS4_16980 [Paenibacillus sp. J31TS4]
MPILLAILLIAVNGSLGYLLYQKVTGSALASGTPEAAAEPSSSPAADEATAPPSQAEAAAETKTEASAAPVQAAAAKPKPTATPTPAPQETTVKLYDGTYRYIGAVTNGAANGQGTAFYKNGQKRFEGEFRNGQPYAGRSYFENGSLRAEAKTSGGSLQITGYNEDGSLYSKTTVPANSKVGTSTIYYPNGSVLYKGQVDGVTELPNGQGTEYHMNGTKRYIGSFKDGKYDGSGTFLTDDQRDSYEGQFTAGEMSGNGRLYADGVLYYEGGNKNGVYDGKGTFYMNGTIAYTGDFVNGNMEGQGKMYDNGKLAYEGEFRNNMPTGNGINHLGGSTISISITTRPPGRTGGTFNMPDGIRIPSYGEVQESLAKQKR